MRGALVVSLVVGAAMLGAPGHSGSATELASTPGHSIPTMAGWSMSGASTLSTPYVVGPERGAIASGRLAGTVIVIDPGHQLGNYRFPDEINRLVDAGGFRKPCNSTGTATASGYPEATFAWRVARVLKRQLVDRGATVRLTRRTNSLDDWGPCINVRGRKGNRVEADAVVSIHGDGAAKSARGFFVIRPGFRAGWTGDITGPSRRLSRAVKHGLVDAGAVVGNTYGGDGFDTRTDLGTLNWSDRPIVMVELGNMRHARDARRMRSAEYRRAVYARGLRLGLTRFLRR